VKLKFIVGLSLLLFIALNRFDSKMSAISVLNPKAEVARAAQALAINISAAKGIQVKIQLFCNWIYFKIAAFLCRMS
jgi:hypothetical protein